MTVDRGARPAQSLSLQTVIAILATLIFALVLWRTAWMCDDAYITLRTIDNVVNGYGLRWNVAERVQSFTHPGWLLVVTPFYAMTREPFFTVLAIQGAIALTTMFVLTRHAALTTAQAGLAAAAVLASKALTEFSTSGLENALTHAALAGVFLSWRAVEAGRSRLTVLALFTSAALLSRQDLVLLVGPVLVSAFRLRQPRRWRALAIGLSPLVLWHVFALVYYGTIVPNTALAKLTTGVPSWDLVTQGVDYWRATFLMDPVTVVLMGLGVVALIATGDRAGRLMAMGAVLYAIYLLRVGGDFMTGRFFTPLLFWQVIGVAGLPSVRWWRWSGRWAWAPAAAILVFGLLAPRSALLTGEDYGARVTEQEFGHFGVADERQFYYPSLGLLRRLGYYGPPADNDWATMGRRVRARTAETQVIAASNVGLFGYHAGPAVHVIDRNGLCDPLLARLPAKQPWRIGHFTRDVPAGYLEGWRSGSNGIIDPRLAAFYDRVRLVTQGSLWGAARWSAIAQLNLGLIDP